MYSVVLMAAMTAGTDAPDCWFRNRHGCNGCGGYVSCAGYGCAGYGCGGYGCAGYGCAGYGSAAGWGYPGSGCAGYGGWGAGYYSGLGCVGCYGGNGYGAYWNATGCFHCHGCYGCYAPGCAGFSTYGPGAATPEQLPPPKVDDKTKTGALPDRARVTVQMPPDAKLYVDETPMKTTAESRTFNTPRLDRGQTYFYEVRAEVVRDGKPVSETKRVLVRAGEDVRVSFDTLEGPTVATAAATPKR
jgi:uncharacterized protein (TIGR03000 family)